ncbi:hypothetical protein LDFHOB_05480 [Candidatus Electronema aureum]
MMIELQSGMNGLGDVEVEVRSGKEAKPSRSA